MVDTQHGMWSYRKTEMEIGSTLKGVGETEINIQDEMWIPFTNMPTSSGEKLNTEKNIHRDGNIYI